MAGHPGTGKTHLAIAIGVQAIEHHRRRVRFFSTVELVNALEQEKLQGKPGQIAARLTHSDLVILDELGYLPFSASGGALLFHLLSKLYERASGRCHVAVTRAYSTHLRQDSHIGTAASHHVFIAAARSVRCV